MGGLLRKRNFKLYFYTLIFAFLIFLLLSENLGDRDAYLNWILKVDKIIASSHQGSLFFYPIAEPFWNYLLFFLKSVFEKPELVLTIINLIVGSITAFCVLKNSNKSSLFSFIFLINIFILSSSLNHVRSGMAMCLVLLTYDYPEFNKSFLSRIIRLSAFFIHMGTIIYIFIDYLKFFYIKSNKLFGRYSSFLLGLLTLISSNLVFLILTKYAPSTETSLGRGSFVGFAFYFIILILILFSKAEERSKNYISIILLSTYISFYFTYPPVGRILEMGYPFIIISVLNILITYKRLMYVLFLAGNLYGLFLNVNLLYVK